MGDSIREVLTVAPPAPALELEDQVDAVATLSNRRGRTLLAGFTAAHFAHPVTNSLLTPLLPLIRDGFGLSYAESGLAVSAYSISLGLSNAPIGALADRIGSRPVIVVGLLLTAALSVALAAAGAYWQLLVLLVLLGLVAGSYHAPAAALIARAFPPQVRGAAIGLHITGGHLSLFLTPLAAGLLVASTGTWRTSYLWLAVAPLLTALPIWRLAPRGEEQRRSVAGPGVLRSLIDVVRLVGPLVSLSILFQLFYAAIQAFMALYLVDARGLPVALAAIYTGAPQLIGVLGAPIGGSLSDRLGRRAVILTGLVLLGPALFGLTIVPDVLLPLPLFGIGLASALRQTVTEVLVMDSAPPQRRAMIMGSYYMLFQQIGGVGAPLLGVLSELFGIGASFMGVTLALAGASMVILAGYRRLL